jgi:hypothetical protein
MKLSILLAAATITAGSLKADDYGLTDYSRKGRFFTVESTNNDAAIEALQRQVAELKAAQEKAEWQAKVEKDMRNTRAIFDGRLDDIE